VDPSRRQVDGDALLFRPGVNMGARHFSFRKTEDLFLVLVCVLVLLPCLYYPYTGVHPDFGFTMTQGDWRIVTAHPCEGPPGTCLEVGDRLLSP
jgi:hypothetical protein